MDNAQSPTETVKRAAFYGRVSTDQQDGSLETQDAKAFEYARLRQFAIPEGLKFADSDTSGSLPLLEREGGQLLINTLPHYPDVKHLIVTKLDRLGRNALDLETTFQMFKQKGIVVHIVDFGSLALANAYLARARIQLSSDRRRVESAGRED